MLFIANIKFHMLPGGVVKTDKNENSSVILNVLVGECPYSVQFMAGTIAKQSNLEVGKTYKFSANKSGEDEHGNTYNLEVLGEASFLEIVQSSEVLGEKKIVDSRVKVKIDEKEFENANN